MIELNFENFINEKLGIREDAVILSDFLYDYIKDFDRNKTIIIDGVDIPKVSFKISKIIIEFVNYDYVGAFDEKRTKLTKDGIEVYLMFRKNDSIQKSSISHELSHLIEHEIKLSKRINDFNSRVASSKISNLLNSKKFDNLCNLIYLSDDSEIRSITHEFYTLLRNLRDSYSDVDKNKFFEKVINYSNIKDRYDKMINYDIFDDLKNISDKVKINFFNDLINWEKKLYKIKKNKNNKLIIILRVIFYLIHKHDRDIDLHTIMYKTQKHINSKGVKLRNNIHRLYDLL